MKKLFFALIIIALITSCERSRKGHWTASDKKEAIADCKNGEKDISNDEREMLNMLDIDKFCDCAVNKVEQDYDSYNKADKTMNDATIEKYAELCVMGAIKTDD